MNDITFLEFITPYLIIIGTGLLWFIGWWFIYYKPLLKMSSVVMEDWVGEYDKGNYNALSPSQMSDDMIKQKYKEIMKI